MRSTLLLTSAIPRAASFFTLPGFGKKNPMRAGRKLFSTTSTYPVFGGDFAGQSATFSSIDGKLIPVPEHLVPDSMVEWGQVPNCLECIVSEDVSEEIDMSPSLERHVVQIMPEVGCGLDNLDTMATKYQLSMDDYTLVSTNDVQIAAAFIEGGKRRVECIFTIIKNNEKKENSTISRIRVTLNLHENDQLRSPIEITKEKKNSDESTKGMIAKGGGLHASTVASLVGIENSNNPFCNEEGRDISELYGTWISQDGGEIFRDDAFWNNDEWKSLSLPGNILVRDCKSSRSMEICMLFNSSDGDDSVVLKRVGMKLFLGKEENAQIFEEVQERLC